MSKKGTVYLVGAGPGDARLMTLRGAELLKRADVVIYDALLNPELLRLVSPSAELIYAGKRASAHAMSQEQLNTLLVEKASAGKTVVRLKGGDPYVFGRGGEEAVELAKKKIPFEVVPGISSVEGVPNYAGIPITHRDICSVYTVITGHEDPGKSDINWEQIAKTPGTKVILMGSLQIANITEALLKHGMPPSTPVAMVRWGTTGYQQSFVSTLKDAASEATSRNFGAPVVTVIGEVVKLRDQLNWFENRPLFGQTIVVTRSRGQSNQLADKLTELGANVLEIPTIKFVEPTERQPLMDLLFELNSYEWLIFTSPNGVTNFFEYFFKGFDDLRDLGGGRIAAVGPGTAAKIKELHLRVDLMPSESISSKIVDALLKEQNIENVRMAIIRAEVANRELPRALEEHGAIVDDIAVYKTVPETEDLTGAAARFLEKGADWITFTSGSTVEHFNQRFPLKELMSKFPNTKLASIGPETSKVLKTFGFEPAVEPKEHTINGLVNAIKDAIKRGQ